MWKYLTGAVLAGALLLSPAFGDSHEKAHQEHNDAFMPGAPGESHIAQEVRHRLLMLPFYGVFDDLAFGVDGGTVTLEGAVVRPVLKSDAENTVKHIEGVTRVINNIKVLPPSPMDNRIRLAEYRAIYGYPALADRYGYRAIPSIHIVVDNGHVRLEGAVANQLDKNLVNVRANSVPGVFSVTNNLKIAP
jgi:BON domain